MYNEFKFLFNIDRFYLTIICINIPEKIQKIFLKENKTNIPENKCKKAFRKRNTWKNKPSGKIKINFPEEKFRIAFRKRNNSVGKNKLSG